MQYFKIIQKGSVWTMKKSLLLDSKEIAGQNISYCIFGKGDIDLVIEMGLGAVAGEWWHIAERLSKQFTVLLEEYRLAHEEKEICQLKEKGDFPQIPVVLITHGSEFETKEIMEFGQTSKEFATKVEELWQSLMQEYLTFSEQSILLRANNSGHYIHLTDFEVIMQALQWLMKRK